MINEEVYKIHEIAVRNYINDHCIVRELMPGKIPGTKYTWMFYLRNGLFNPQFLRCVSEMMMYRIYQELGNFDFQVCGAETAGTPIAAALPLMCQAHGIPMSGFVVRKEQKEYGLLNWHEGIAYSNLPYVLVDDLCNSSRSLQHADNICRDTLNLPSSKLAIVIVNKVNKLGHEEGLAITDKYMSKDTKVISLFDLDSFNLSCRHD